MVSAMKTISLCVSEDEYATFRRAARAQQRSTAELIREAMALYREVRLERRRPLRDLPLLAGHRALGPVPTRGELYEEIFGGDRDSTP